MQAHRHIGRYEVLDTGAPEGHPVALARDPVLGRRVAILTLQPAMLERATRDHGGASPQGAEPPSGAPTDGFARMRQVVRNAAAVSHPALVAMHDMIDAAPVALYVVFELVDGPSLRERLLDGPLPLHEAASLARALGDALTHAHDDGVEPCEVTPDTILLGRTGPKLLPIPLRSAPLPDASVAGPGASNARAAGAGAAGESGAESDQRAFAIALYEAIAGRPALESAHPDAGRWRRSEPDAPSLTAPLRPLSSLPGSPLHRADAALRRGLLADPARRYATCRDLGNAVAIALESSWTAASEPPPLSRPSLVQSLRASIVPRATRRVHNAFAVTALLVITALLVFGRRGAPATPSLSGVSMRRVATSFAGALASASLEARPLPSRSAAQRRPTTTSAAPSVSARVKVPPVGSSSTASPPEMLPPVEERAETSEEIGGE